MILATSSFTLRVTKLQGKMTFQATLVISSIFLLLHASLVISSTYRAAVVEFAPESYLVGNPTKLSKKEANNKMKLNLDELEKLVKSAREQHAQIIVFPEDSITGQIFCNNCKDVVKMFGETIPEIEQGATVIPCGNHDFTSSTVLQRLSCMAKANTIVLVANMPDIQGSSLFQTNVIFESDGSLIAKYHKQHLFKKEAEIFTVPTDNTYRYTIFRTKFHVEFSVFICYDILFCDPPLEMVKRGIKNFVYSAYWGNKYPHYMSNSVRQGWSWKNKVNILCSGIHNKFEKHGSHGKKGVYYYSSGSGIYSAGKPLDYYISGEKFVVPSGKVIIADVPREPGEVQMISNGKRSNLHDLKSLDTPLTYRELDYNKTELIVGIKVESFPLLKCKLKYEFEYVGENEKYALAASIYPNKPKDSPLNYALCSLSLRPADGKPQSKGYSVHSKFKSLKITWVYSDSSQPNDKITVIPMVLGDKLRLFDPSNFILEHNSLELNSNGEGGVSVLVANLWGKIAGKDDGYCSYPENSYCEAGHESACNEE